MTAKKKLWLVHVETDLYVVAEDETAARVEGEAVELDSVETDSWATEVNVAEKDGSPRPIEAVLIGADWADAIPYGDEPFDEDAPDLTVQDIVERLQFEARVAADRARNGVLFPGVNPQPLPPVERPDGEQEGDAKP